MNDLQQDGVDQKKGGIYIRRFESRENETSLENKQAVYQSVNDPPPQPPSTPCPHPGPALSAPLYSRTSRRLPQLCSPPGHSGCSGYQIYWLSFLPAALSRLKHSLILPPSQSTFFILLMETRPPAGVSPSPGQCMSLSSSFSHFDVLCLGRFLFSVSLRDHHLAG